MGPILHAKSIKMWTLGPAILGVPENSNIGIFSKKLCNLGSLFEESKNDELLGKAFAASNYIN